MPYHKHESQPVLQNRNSKLIYDRSNTVTSEPTVHSDRPHNVMIDKTTKAAYSVDIAIPKSQPSQDHHLEAPEVCRHERRAYKNMSTDNTLYNATSAIHSGYLYTQITRKFQTASSPRCSVHSNAESSST